jgi:hypothetical protein
MSRSPKAIPAEVLRGVTDARTGWQKALITFGPPRPDARGCEGLVDPDGRPWEIACKIKGPLSPRGEKEMATRIHQTAPSYEHCLVTVGAERFLVERFINGNGIRLWDGLRVLAHEWVDGSCDGCPWQHHVTAEWVHPGGQAVEKVSLYIRWRSWGINPERTLWTGHVLRYDHEKDPFEAIRCPWSPNLLPTVFPTAEPAIIAGSGDKPTGLRGFLDGLFDPEAKPRPKPPDVGFTEDEEAKAKRALVERAEVWLREHGEDQTAWTGLQAA